MRRSVDYYLAKFERTAEVGLDEMHPSAADAVQREEASQPSVDPKTGAPAFMSAVNGDKGPRLVAKRHLFQHGDPNEDRPILMEPGGHVSAARPAGTPSAKMKHTVSMDQLSATVDGDDDEETTYDGHPAAFAQIADTWGEDSLAVKGRFVTPGELLRKAGGMGRLTQVTPHHGSSPREETPAMPDFQEIYYQPEDDERKQREIDQARTRRAADSSRNTAKYGFHGIAPQGSPEIRWEPDENPVEHAGPKLANREPTSQPDLDQERIRAGTKDHEYPTWLGEDEEDDDDEDDDSPEADERGRVDRKRGY